MPELANELHLVPGNEVATHYGDVGIRPLPGRMIVWMHNPETSGSGVYLPASGRMRPDVGVLAHDFEYHGQVFPEGTVVGVGPYRGAWFDHENGNEYRIYGVSEDLIDAFLMFWDGDWKPAPGWNLVEREMSGSSMIDANWAVRGVGRMDGCRVVFDDPDFVEGSVPDVLEVPLIGKTLVGEIYVYA